MKHLNYALVAILLSALVTTNGAKAQKTDFSALYNDGSKVTLTKAVPANLTYEANALSGISTKAIKDFSKTHKNVSNEKWNTTADGFSATFTENDAYNVVFYSKKGSWVGEMKGYVEEKMPAAIRKIVKREYYDSKITYVQEVETLNSYRNVTYIVHLEDANTIKLVRVCDGEMDVCQQYTKGN